MYGDGGLITTDDASLFERLAKLRNHGLRNRDQCELWGYNSRLDPLQAAFAAVKLEQLDHWNARCRGIAAQYREALRGRVWVPRDRPHEEPVYHNFVIQLERRDALIEHLNACGVGTRIHYPIPIHLQECAAGLGYRAGDFPVAERQARTILSLPIYPELTQAEIEHVIASVQSLLGLLQPPTQSTQRSAENAEKTETGISIEPFGTRMILPLPVRLLNHDD